MPLYEYVCEQEGHEPVVIELLRASKDADKPVEDPEGKGRLFRRRLSVFASGGTAGGHVHTGTCGCGKRQGGCGGPPV